MCLFAVEFSLDNKSFFALDSSTTLRTVEFNGQKSIKLVNS